MEKTTLGRFAEIIMGQSPKSEYYNAQGVGMPFLQGNRTFGRKYPYFDTYTEKAIKVAEAGDVIMSVRAPVGDINITPRQMCLGRGVCSIRARNGKQNFLYYLMRYKVRQLIARENGTVFGSVNFNDISSLDIELPTDIDQERIGSMLAQIDDKIENNCAINDNLQQQAFEIFNALFPNCTDGEMCVGHYIIPRRGKNLLTKDAVGGDVPVVAGGLEPSTYHNVANTVPPVITISASGANAGFTRLWHIPVWSSDSSYIDATMTDAVYFWYALIKRRQREVFDMQTGSAQAHIYPQNIAAMPIPQLDKQLVHEYSATVTPLFDKIGTNIAENCRLAALRDTLLPKLMSGEIDVSKVEI